MRPPVRLLILGSSLALAALGLGLLTAGPPEPFEPMGVQAVDRGTGSGPSQSAFVMTQGRLHVHADGNLPWSPIRFP